MRGFASLSTLVSTLAACSGTPHVTHTAENAQLASPLGASYVLNPLPSDDDALLGSVLTGPPGEGRSLAEMARPNPCGDKLTDATTTPTVGTFKNAEELAPGRKASAALGSYGFAFDASEATHFVYTIETSKQEVRAATNDYVQCCKEKGGCGYPREHFNLRRWRRVLPRPLQGRCRDLRC